MADPLVIATDGSCLVNPDGPGGWAWAVSPDHWRAGGHASTTNNKMELRAVFEALSATPADGPTIIETDSMYVINSLTRWLSNWKRNGWRNSKKEPVANREAIELIDGLLVGRAVTWQFVKGHTGHVLNEVCDLRAGAAAAATRDGAPVDEGPGLLGWPGAQS